MASELLQRQPVAVATLGNDTSLRDLAVKAEKSLNYLQLTNFLKDKDNGILLDQTLVKLDIQPFETSKVDEYQERMFWGSWYDLREWTGLIRSFCSVVGIACLLGGIASIGAAIVTSGYHRLVVLGLPVAWFGLSECARIWKSIENTPARRWMRWYQVELDDYSEAVPEFALQTALRIKEILPDARLVVEHLGRSSASIKNRSQSQSLDPFLLVEYGDKEYYIEVWDEPKFETEHLYRS